jgi:hypothetical protein
MQSTEMPTAERRRKLQHRYVADHTFSSDRYQHDAKATPDVAGVALQVLSCWWI